MKPRHVRMAGSACGLLLLLLLAACSGARVSRVATQPLREPVRPGSTAVVSVSSSRSVSLTPDYTAMLGNLVVSRLREGRAFTAVSLESEPPQPADYLIKCEVARLEGFKLAREGVISGDAQVDVNVMIVKAATGELLGGGVIRGAGAVGVGVSGLAWAIGMGGGADTAFEQAADGIVAYVTEQVK